MGIEGCSRAANDSEELREALITLERLRRREEDARKEAQALLSGLHVLNNVQAVDEMFRGILEVIKAAVPFTEAAILLEESDGALRIAASSSERFQFTVTSGELFQRVLGGQSAAISDLSKTAEWRQIAGQLSEPYESAVLAPLETPKNRALLICVHRERSFLSRSHLLVLKTFSPLATQALLRSQQLEDLKALVGRLDYLAHHDALTGLPNRAAFRTELSAALDDARLGRALCGLFLIDVDHFKEVNDTFGHPTGDALLQETAMRLTQISASGAVARIAGDEFAIVVRVDDADDVAAIARDLIASMKFPVVAGGHNVALSLTAGIALGPNGGSTPDELIRHADLALYRAKRQQRGSWRLFDPEVDRDHVEKRGLEAAIRRALDADEFCVFYQPQINLLTGALVGYEALVRWNDPSFGMRMPNEFIPVAEEAGLIGRLGEWVLKKACADAAHWPKHIRVAVNLSAEQLRADDLDQNIARILRRTGLPPQRLEVEITESVLITDCKKVLTTLERLRARGVQIAMDDFGTGYSSLNYLASIKFDKIKIDRSFVAKLGKDQHVDAIVSMIIGLGRSLQVAIIAEGVETETQRVTLRGMGCQFGQGYLFGKPAPLAQLPIERLTGAEAG